jgi:DNA repair photolyase
VEFRNPVAIITKNHLVTRDIDLLSELARHEAAAVFISVTSLDADLARKLEPRTSTPEHRLDAVRKLSRAGIPTGVMVAPVIPAINDVEIPAILKAAAQAGAGSAGWVMVRLPYGVKNLFEEWLARHFPDRKEKVLHRIQSIRGGKLNDPTFGRRMRGEGVFAEQIARLFELGLKKAGLARKQFSLSTASFRRPLQPDDQLELFS